MKNIITKMSKNGLILYEKTNPYTLRMTKEETCEALHREIDFSKYDNICEIAHLEISNRCNMDCKYCYTGVKSKDELTLAQWMEIIDKLADYGIFQVSFGGGEPTMYPYMVELGEYVRSKGLNLGMTTNGSKLHEMPLIWPKLKELFNQINVSWHQNVDTVSTALKVLKELDIKAGINYCFSKDMAKDNHTVKSLARTWNAEVLYLAYKPVIGDYNNLIEPDVVYSAAKEASDEGLKVAVDGPCAGECMMKKRFIDVDHLGNVFPCSFVRKSMGNLLENNLHDIWASRGEQEECPYIEIPDKEKDG